MAPTGSWLDWLKAKQTPAASWADQRRNEALELIASTAQSGSWAQLSRHHNGFVREVAVRELASTPSPEALVELIERLNDWVPQVRELAAAGIKAYLNSPGAPALLCALDPLMALAARQRADHGPTLAKVRAVLQGADVRDVVYACFQVRHGKAACYLFALLLEVVEPPGPLLRDGLAHRELNVRLAAIAACEANAGTEALALLEAALPRSIARVRVRLLRALVPLLEDPKAVLQAALLDASPAVRSFARWEAPRHGVDAHAVLAAQLAQPMPSLKKHWLGLLGLAGEIGGELPEAWRSAALLAGYPSVRLAAVHLQDDASAGTLLGLLEDDADKVFDAVIARLGKLPWAALNAPVSASLDTHWQRLPEQRRRQVLGLMSPWQQAAYLVKRMQAEPVLEDFWLQEITRWCNRQYRIVDPVTPVAEREALEQTLKGLAASGLIERGCVARVVK